MAVLLRLAGIFIIVGTLFLVLGGMSSIQRSQIESARALHPSLAQISLDTSSWVLFAPQIGLVLLALGGIAIIVVIVILIRDLLPSRADVNDGDENPELTVTPTTSRNIIPAAYDPNDITSILNTVLQVENANIVNCPGWINHVNNKTTSEKLERLARESMRYFDTVCDMIRKLDGTPSSEFHPPGDETDPRRTLQDQLYRVRAAKLGYQRASELTSDPSLREVLLAYKAAEEEHITILEEVLSELFLR